MKLSILAAVMALTFASSTSAFTFNTLNVPSPVLTRFHQDTSVAKKPTEDVEMLMDVKLEVGKDDRMSLNGLQLELLPDNIERAALKNFPGLPGAQGPNPKSSTGAKHLNVKHKPFFISMNGKQTVDLTAASWEIVWVDGSDNGRLVCGFTSPNTYKRNDATLPKGSIYMSWPVWTKETLDKTQKLKAKSEAKGKKILEEKADAMRKYEEETNLFKKAMYYKDALNAAERFSLIPLYKDAPSDKDAMVLQGDLILNTKGMVWASNVWTKKDGGGIFAAFGSPLKDTVLGTATLSPVVIKETNQDEIDVSSAFDKTKLRP